MGVSFADAARSVPPGAGSKPQQEWFNELMRAVASGTMSVEAARKILDQKKQEEQK